MFCTMLLITESQLLCYFRYYDGDQDRLFSEAHVISPHRREVKRVQERKKNFFYYSFIN